MKRRIALTVAAVAVLAGCGPATAGLAVLKDTAGGTRAVVSKPAPPAPVKRVDTGPGFDDVATYCEGKLRVFVTQSDTHSSSGIAVALDEAGCP